MKRKNDSLTGDILPQFFFIVVLLFSIHFWGLKYIPEKNTFMNFSTYFICAFSLIMVIQKENLHFKNAILLFIFGLIVNSLPAYLNLGQSPHITLLSFEFYYFILLYFLLHYLKLSRKFLENTIIVFAIIYSIIYILQTHYYPYYILRTGIRMDKGEYQFAILGHGFLMLAYFLFLNRFLQNRKLINLLLAIVFFMVLLRSNYRTLIAGAMFVTVLMLIKVIKFNIKNIAILVFVTLLFVGLFQLKGASKIFKQSVAITQQNLEQGNKYVRWIQLEFYFKKYPKDFSYFVLGGGKPSRENLWKFDQSVIGMNYNIVWVDIGLLGFYIVIGAVAISGILWYTLKAIFIKLPQEYLYLNFYFLYLFIVSFTNEEIYRNGIFSVQAVGLYLIDIAINEKSVPGGVAPGIETNSSVKT